jgi:Zc3h12a-like Ribonuclease NYN domain
MTPTKRLRVVVDGSNLATEGRVVPSVAQLREAVVSFQSDHPTAELVVVVDASFEHRVPEAERAAVRAADAAGEFVAPPAGAVGRGDAFILKIADKIAGVVLSNDSFQEFQSDYPWLFDEGRLIGGKPVRNVGWVFTPRLPVRAIKKSAKPTGEAPAKPPLKAPAKKVDAAKAVKAPAKKVDAAKVAKSPAKKVTATGAQKAPAKKATATGAQKAPAKKATAPAAQKAPAKKLTTAALRRDREPVNGEAVFTAFTGAHRVRGVVEGVVSAFTSHGAVITVTTSAGAMECYAPTTGLGTPAPARARDVLKRGDKVKFKLVSVDKDRRIAELVLP